VREVARRERAERHARHLASRAPPTAACAGRGPRRPRASPAERLEHPLRLAAFAGLPSSRRRRRRSCRRRARAVAAVDRARLPGACSTGSSPAPPRSRARRLEGNAELSEDRVPLRRGRGEDQRRCRRTRQISSNGHCFDHAGLEG
jgi:hypothetical protein